MNRKTLVGLILLLTCLSALVYFSKPQLSTNEQTSQSGHYAKFQTFKIIGEEKVWITGLPNDPIELRNLTVVKNPTAISITNDLKFSVQNTTVTVIWKGVSYLADIDGKPSYYLSHTNYTTSTQFNAQLGINETQTFSIPQKTLERVTEEFSWIYPLSNGQSYTTMVVPVTIMSAQITTHYKD